MSIADRIAGALGARKAGGWWRTSTAHCHGGDTVNGLAFRSPGDDPGKLNVRCYSRGCHETFEGLNRTRDNLRVAELRAQRISWARVASTLTDARVRTRRGTAFSRQGLSKIAKRAGIK